MTHMDEKMNYTLAPWLGLNGYSTFSDAQSRIKVQRKHITGGISSSTRLPLFLGHCKMMTVSDPLNLMKMCRQAVKSYTGASDGQK